MLTALARRRRPTAPALAAVVLLWAAVITIAPGAAYTVSIRRHPYRPCRKCGEFGKHRGTVFPRSFRACTRCGGTGRELRPFAKEPEPHS